MERSGGANDSSGALASAIFRKNRRIRRDVKVTPRMLGKYLGEFRAAARTGLHNTLYTNGRYPYHMDRLNPEGKVLLQKSSPGAFTGGGVWPQVRGIR